MQGPSAIELRRLGKDFGSKRALRDVALSIAFGIAQTVLVLLHQAFGAAAVVMGGTMLVAMGAAAWGLRWGAASRVARLEYPH